MSENKLRAKVVNQIDNVVTLAIDSDYMFEYGEPVELDTLKETFREQLLALYWILQHWMIDNKQYKRLPESQKWFRESESKIIALEKLYTLSRFVIGWVETSYNKDGMKTIRARSTGEIKCNQRQLSDVYDKTYAYYASYVDMTNFEIQHQKAREALGKI